jgi:PBP1b-binding outer membrane lipoprotein LpoB
MKQVIIVLLLAIILAGCKKNIEKIKENAVISAMTDGQWIITNFVNNGTVITSDFSSYKFQYYSNKTVDAINNGVVEKTGTWDGDASTMTITANFPNAGPTVTLINGSWHIDNNSWTFVVASQISGSQAKTLRLEKL